MVTTIDCKYCVYIYFFIESREIVYVKINNGIIVKLSSYIISYNNNE